MVCANRTKVNFPIRNPWTRERDYGFEAILCSRVGWITDWQYGLRIDKIAFGREVWFLIFFNWKLGQASHQSSRREAFPSAQNSPILCDAVKLYSAVRLSKNTGGGRKSSHAIGRERFGGVPDVTR